MLGVNKTDDSRSASATQTVAPQPGGGIVATTSAKLLDRLSEALRSRHYSRRTEETYRHWVKRFIYFHNDVKTTMIYTHALNRGPAGVRSPVDRLSEGGSYADPHNMPE